MRRNEKGQAYIYVVILTTALLSMLSIALYITGYEVQVTSSYKENANLYPLAASGAEEALAVMEGLAESHREELLQETLNKIMTDDLLDLIEYRLSASDDPYERLYEGDFYFKKKDGEGLLGESDELFADVYGKLALDYVWENLEDDSGFSFDIGEINVSVTIIKDEEGLLVLSAAREGERSSTVEGRVCVDFGKHEERLAPVLDWKAPPGFIGHGAYAGGRILIEGTDIYIEDGVEYQPSVIYGGISLPEHAWSEREPFIFANRVELDVSLIYSRHTEEPVFTAVYSSGDVKLAAGDQAKSSFCGVIAAQGNIEIQDVSVRGSLIAAGDIVFKQNESIEISVEKDDGAIFRIGRGSSPLYRKWLDKLGVTAFYNIDPEQYRNSGARLEALLNNARLVPEECGLEIRGAKGRLFGFEWLRETDL